MDDKPSDLIFDIRRVGSWRLIAASYRGLGHIAEDVPRQDAYHLAVQSDATSTFCVGIADGLSTADYSHLGALHVCESVCRRFADKPYSLTTRDAIETLFTEVKGDFDSFSQSSQLTQRQLATTLQFFAFVGTLGCYFRVGDGGCVVLKKGESKWLGAKDRAALGVSNLADPQALRALTFDGVDLREVDSIFLFSDGVQDFFIEDMSGDTIKPHQKNVERFDQICRGNQLETTVAQLNRILGSDHGKDMKDDKTLFIAIREDAHLPTVIVLPQPDETPVAQETVAEPADIIPPPARGLRAFCEEYWPVAAIGLLSLLATAGIVTADKMLHVAPVKPPAEVKGPDSGPSAQQQILQLQQQIQQLQEQQRQQEQRILEQQQRELQQREQQQRDQQQQREQPQ